MRRRLVQPALVDRLSRIVVAVSVLLAWTVAAAVHAGAVAAWGVEAPAAGARLDTAESTRLIAYAETGPAERVEQVDARILRAGSQVGSVTTLRLLSTAEPEPGRHVTRWWQDLDPMATPWTGSAIANGRYILQVRVHTSVQDVPQEPTEWAGHEVVFDVPAPAVSVKASLVDPEQRQVEIAWAAAGVPDFTRYIVQRASSGSDFLDIHVATDDSETSYTDTPPADGSYRYRVITGRSGAEGTEHRTASASHSVAVSPDAPSEQPTEGPPPSESDGQAPADEGEGSVGGGTLRIGQGQAGPPSVSGNAPPVLPGQGGAAGAPRVGGASGFDESLDYGSPPPPETVTEETLELVEPGSVREGGVLSITTRELVPERVLIPVAGGLVLILAAGHLLRFARGL